MNASIVDLLSRLLDPEDQSTGGGPAAAVNGAVAARLIYLTTSLSTDRGLSESNAFFETRGAAALQLLHLLIEGAVQDAASFDQVFEGYQMPQTSPAARKVRSAAIQAALIQATRIPLENARLCREVLLLASQLAGKINRNLNSDLESARLLSQSGMGAAIASVESNLKSIKDLAFKAEVERTLQSLL
jgi:glutamate formiminotransferase/formiminotetrahydrofolate cyclodeaminase